MDFKNILDSAGATVKMAGRQDAAGIFHPVHQSEIVTVQTSLQRPNDTTAYTAGDMVCVLFTFDIGALGLTGGGVITGSRLIRDVTTDQTVKFRAFVHNAVPATPPAGDNAPAPLLFANRLSRRGWIDYVTPITGDAAGSDSLEYPGLLSNAQGLPVDPSDGIVRVMLTTRDVFTPAAQKTFAIELDLVV